MTTAREPPPPEVQEHPRFCRGAGHAGRFRLRPEITFERFMETMAQAHAMMPKLIGLTSFRILRFDDGSFLHRMTFVSVAAWKRHSAQMDQTNAISNMMHTMLDLEHSEIWMGMFTLIPARYAPDLDHPAAPRPSNPCEIEHGLQTAAAAANSDDDDGALPDGSIRDEDDCDDDRDTASSIVSLSVTVNATDRRHARRLPSIGSVRSAATAASSSSSPAVDVLSPSPSDFLSYQSASTVAQPPSRAYTEARSSAGLTPDRESPYGAAGHRGGVNFSSYWRSAAWSAPSAAPASVPRVPDPYFSPSTSRRIPHPPPSSPSSPSSESRASRTKLKGLPREMVHHMPEACYTILPPSAGPREEGSADDAKLGFTIVIDGDPTRHFQSVSATTTASKKQRVIYLPAVGQPAATREAKLQQHQQQLSKPQPPTEMALASTTGRASSAGAGSSSDDHNRGATRGSTPTSVTCTVGDDDPVIPEATVVSSSLSTTSTSKAASTTATSKGIRGGHKKAPVLCVLVAFADDKKKKKCRLDTAVCPEPHPGQVVTVRDGVAPSGGDPNLRSAKVLTVTPWSTRKGGGNSGSIAALPAVVSIVQAA